MGTPATGPAPLPEVLAFTGETRGYLEPCGCTDRMLGGLARRAALLARLRRLGRRPQVFETGDLVEEPGRQTDLKLEALTASFREIGVQGVALGERDLVLGWERLQEISRAGRFSWIATNLVATARADEADAGSKAPSTGRGPSARTAAAPLSTGAADAPRSAAWFRTSIAVSTQAGPLRVEAYLSPRYAGDVEALTDGRFTLSLPTGKAPQVAGASPLVVLYHGPAEEAARLLRDRADISYVVAGHGRLRPGTAAALANGAPVVALSDRGKDVTLVDLLPPAAGETALRFGAARPVALSDQVPDDPAVAAIYARYDRRLYEANLVQSIDRRSPATGGRFTGPGACIACHPKEGLVFRSMAHRHAYEALPPKKKERDPECLGCHTTGFGYESGFAGLDRTPALAGVSCESCHGVGSNHVAAPQPGYGRIPNPETLCRTCHDALNSPRFDFPAYWKKIAHGH